MDVETGNTWGTGCRGARAVTFYKLMCKVQCRREWGSGGSHPLEKLC